MVELGRSKLKSKIYQVDAFANQLFSGNPAAICPLSSWIADNLMQKIAQENNLSETAFIVPAEDKKKEKKYDMRFAGLHQQKKLIYVDMPPWEQLMLFLNI